MSDLAETIEEGKRLEEAATFVGRESVPWEEFCDADARVDAFYAEHGPRLARVAEIACEVAEDPYNTGAFERLRAVCNSARGAK